MKSPATTLIAGMTALIAAGAGAPLAAHPSTTARVDGLVGSAKNKKPATIVVQVKPLHDAGGLSAVSADGDKINVSYTEAISHFLANGGYTIVDKVPKGQVPKYSIEGDLSHLAVDDKGSGPYLCVLRLFDENQKHKLVGQWAGVAQSLRYLTANLNETEGVDSEGLLGELGGKIAEAIRATSDSTGAATFDAIVDVASQTDLIDAFPVAVDKLPAVTPAVVTPPVPAKDPKPTAVVTPPPAPKSAPEHNGMTEHIGQPEPPTPNQVTSGAPYRLQIRSTEAGSITLVGVGSVGEPIELPSPPDTADVTVVADKPVVLPLTGQFTAPEVTAPQDVRYVVLERRSGAPSIDATAENLLPARVLVGTTPTTPPPVKDAAIATLLRHVLGDPPHTWVAHIITLHVVPKP